MSESFDRKFRFLLCIFDFGGGRGVGLPGLVGWAGLGWAGPGRAGRLGLGRVGAGMVAVGAAWNLFFSYTFNENLKMQFEAKFIQLLFSLFLRV